MITMFNKPFQCHLYFFSKSRLKSPWRLSQRPELNIHTIYKLFKGARKNTNDQHNKHLISPQHEKSQAEACTGRNMDQVP